MRLLLDVGNTRTKIGHLKEGEIKKTWERQTRAGETADELWNSVRSLTGADPEKTSLSAVSVVPSLSTALQAASVKYLSGRIFLLEAPWDEAEVKIGTQEPARVGADRVAAAEAAYRLYGGGIVVDFGTATTVEVISGEGAYLGGVILPGVDAAAESLTQAAASLPVFSPQRPASLETGGTEAALQSGLYFGTAGAVERIVRGVRKKFGLPQSLPVVITGGRGEEFEPIIDEVIELEPDLVLKGLNFIVENAR